MTKNNKGGEKMEDTITKSYWATKEIRKIVEGRKRIAEKGSCETCQFCVPYNEMAYCTIQSNVNQGEYPCDAGKWTETERCFAYQPKISNLVVDSPDEKEHSNRHREYMACLARAVDLANQIEHIQSNKTQAELEMLVNRLIVEVKTMSENTQENKIRRLEMQETKAKIERYWRTVIKVEGRIGGQEGDRKKAIYMIMKVVVQDGLILDKTVRYEVGGHEAPERELEACHVINFALDCPNEFADFIQQIRLAMSETVMKEVKNEISMAA